MIDKVLRQDCVGCKACGDICPANAIDFKTDGEGFWYPELNRDACLNCGLCSRVCPAIECHYASKANYPTPKVYKVYHRDAQIRYNSTSGALYYGLADAFLKDGGSIAGCVYDDDCKGAHHIVSNDYDGLKRIMRTKYFQSDTAGIYRQVKELLDAGEKVLFCGSPCQVSALYGFVRREYENLYTLDFICKGTNSPLAFRKFIEELEAKYKSKAVEVHLKNKSRGWTNLGTLVTFRNGKKYYGNQFNDAWVVGQNELRLFMRDCCSNCRYKSFPRIADITMGDFWGLKFTAEEERLGVSVAMVNTPRGEALLDRAKEAFIMEERALETAKKGNPMIDNSVRINPAKGSFFQRVQTEPFSKIVWELHGTTDFRRWLRVSKDRARRTYRKIREARMNSGKDVHV